MQKPLYSTVSALVCIILLVYVGNIHFKRWDKLKSESTFGWDAGEYYAYLPSVFIYHDVQTQHRTDSVRYEYRLQADNIPGSRPDTIKVLNYSSGMALIYTPAFFIAHILAEPFGYPSDGFSRPYQMALTLYCMLIAIIGLWYLRKLLLFYYSDTVVAITLILIVIGTGYLNYATADAILPHSSLFTIYVLLLLATRRFYIQPNVKAAVAIGLLYGLAILIRPSEMVAAVIPLLWGLEKVNLTSIRKHLNFLRQNIKYIFITAVCTVCIGSIQTMYWYYVTGKLFYYSYEFGFFWDGRFLYDFLFSWGYGWIMYNPMVSFAVLGLIIYLFKGKHKVAIVLFSVLNLYIISAWEIWYYSGLPGRAMVQSYAILAVPFALFIEWALSVKVIRFSFSLLATVFLYFNIWLFHNAHLPPALFQPGAMTGAYFRTVVGRWNVSKQVEKLKDSNELYTGHPKNIQLLYFNDFEEDTTSISPIGGINSNNGICINSETTFSPSYRIARKNVPDATHVRITFDAKAPIGEWDNWRMIQCSVSFINKDGVKVKDNMMRVSRFVNSNDVSNVFLDTKLPDNDYEYIEVLFWNPGSNGIFLADNLKVYSFEE